MTEVAYLMLLGRIEKEAWQQFSIAPTSMRHNTPLADNWSLNTHILLNTKRVVLVLINILKKIGAQAHFMIPYSGKFWREKTLTNSKLNCIWQRKFWRI